MHYRRGDGAHWLIPMATLWPFGAYDNIRWDGNPKAVGYLLLFAALVAIGLYFSWNGDLNE